MKMIDDLKAAATNGSHMQGLRNDVVLLLCEAVEALEAVVNRYVRDVDVPYLEECERASNLLDKLRSYAP